MARTRAGLVPLAHPSLTAPPLLLPLSLLLLLPLVVGGVHMDPPLPRARTCTLDSECAATHQGVCAAANVGAPGRVGVCVCGAGQSWHTLLRACIPRDVGAAVDLGNATLAYGATSAGTARFAPDLRWPSAWSCDAAQCRATEYNATYVTWRRDVVLAAAADGTGALADVANWTLAPEDVWLRCAAPPTAAYLRAAASDASDPAQAGVAAWRHCATCAQWCGANGRCDAVATAARSAVVDPATSGFVCACSAGWSGDRCEVPTDALLAGNTDGGTGALGSDASASMTFVARRAFPAYDLARACAVDADCAGGGVTERCYIHVPESRRLGRLARVCFCAPGFVPLHGTTTGCVRSATQTIALFGSITTGDVRVGSTLSADGAALGAALVTPAWAAGSASSAPVGLLATAQTAAGDTVITPMLRPVNGAAAAGAGTAGIDPLTAAYARANPYLLACAASTGGGYFIAGAGVDATRWCGTCATVCGTGALCDEAAAANTERADTGACVCASADVDGTACDACVDAARMPPACNQTWDACAAQRCSSRGACVTAAGAGDATGASTTCVCDDGWVGPACASMTGGCRLANCSAHGTCTAVAGVCACDAGWVGADCSVRARECGVALCSAHGACTADMRCACDSGWAGASCERRWCGAHGGVSVVTGTDAATGAPLLGCDCTAGGATGGWAGASCEVDVCGESLGRGAWDQATASCACAGVYAVNASALPRCSAHRCGEDGWPVRVDVCQCRSARVVAFNAADLAKPGTFLCQPRAPIQVASTTWSAASGRGAVADYQNRPVVYVLPPFLTALTLVLSYACASGAKSHGGAVPS